MDGTLFNSEPTHHRAFENVFKKYGKQYVDFKTQQRMYSGTGIHNTLSKEAERLDVNEDVEKLQDEFNHNLERLIETEGLIPMPGAIDFLMNAKNKGFKLAVVSGSATNTIRQFIERSEVPDIFDELVGADKVSNPKPAPDCYLLAAKLLGVKPANCLAFEDAPNGLVSANDAGMDVVAIGEVLSREQLAGINPVIINLKDFTEIEIT